MKLQSLTGSLGRSSPSSGKAASRAMIVLGLTACAAIAAWFAWPGLRETAWKATRLALPGHDRDEHAAEHRGENEHALVAAAGEDAEAHHDHGPAPQSRAAATPHAGESVSDHAHSEAEALKLGATAQRNIGVRLTKVELKPYVRSITVPGIVVERPGWSRLEVTAPMTGAVTRIFPVQGEAVKARQPLFEVRLTHEDLLQKQTDFLRTVEELDVVGREITRLEKVAAEGAVAGKTLLERKYEEQRQQAFLRAQRQALLLHGLSGEQIDGIERTRTLLQSLTLVAPAHSTSATEGTEATYQVQELKVSQGSHVNAGATLCMLADHDQLYIEGKAFEQDVKAIQDVVACRLSVTALAGTATGERAETVSDLQVLYVGDRVDAETRTFSFYVVLPNQLVGTNESPDGRKFVTWRFKPGQRLQIMVPVETWNDRIVLPLEAVAQEGAEFYVFEANGDHFDRRPVHVEYQDQLCVVIANDGAVKPGAMVAESAAHQMQMVMKSKRDGGIDPHAGHNH